MTLKQWVTVIVSELLRFLSGVNSVLISGVLLLLSLMQKHSNLKGSLK